MSDRIQTYAEFWPFYVREHSKSATRWLHFTGTNLGIALAVVAIAQRDPWLVPAALVSSYAFAWFAHFVIEKNRPATFKYPLWSFISDFRMCGRMWSGRPLP